jgi:hypothetical protein
LIVRYWNASAYFSWAEPGIVLKVFHKVLRHHHMMQVGIVVMNAYLAYMISEVCGYAGAFIFLVSAVIMAHYAKYNCSADALVATKNIS